MNNYIVITKEWVHTQGMKVLNKQGQKGIFTKGDNMLKEILDYIQQIAKIGLFIALTAWVVNNWNNTLSIYHMGGIDVKDQV